MINCQTEQQRLKTQILDQTALAERQKLAIMELADKKQANLDNIAASEKAIVGLLDQLEKQPGKIEALRLKSQMSNLQALIDRQLLENVEFIERKDKILESWQAALKAREHFERNLSSMAEAHGTLTEDKYKEMYDFLTRE